MRAEEIEENEGASAHEDQSEVLAFYRAEAAAKTGVPTPLERPKQHRHKNAK